MPIDPRIALGVQPLQVADPLAQYGQVQNILASQSQQQAAQMQMQQTQRQIQQDEDYVTKMAEAIGKNGGPSDMMQAARVMAGNRNAQVSATGIQMLQSLQRLDAAKKAGVYGTVAPTAMPSVAPASGTIGSGTFDPNAPVSAPMPTQAQRFTGSMGTNLPPVGAANQLAPAPAAPVNKLVDNTAALRAEYAKLSEYEDLPGVKDRMDLIKDRLKEANTLRVVGRNLVTGTGDVIFTAPQDTTPSEIKRLTAERDALPLTDPNRRLYDQAIANLGSTERLAQERLNFDRSKFAWEKSNPGYTIQQAEDGSIVGVNNRTLQAFPVNLNATPPPVAAPFGGGGARAPGGAGKRGGVVAPVAEPIIQPQGAPLIGKASGSTEGERKAATLLQRLQFSQNQLTQALTDDPKAAGPEAFAAAVGKFSTTASNLLNSQARQRVEAAQLDILDAALTLGTGAAYTREQLEGYRQAYFPAYGDEPQTILDKQARLQNVIEAAQIAAGKAGKLVPAQTPVAPAPGGSDVRSKADQILKRKP
jgi:hypothetical protein